MIFRIINLILALFVFGFIYQKAVTQSFYNWDAIAYTMAVQLDEGKTTEEAHEYTYKTLESEVDPGLLMLYVVQANIVRTNTVALIILNQ